MRQCDRPWVRRHKVLTATGSTFLALVLLAVVGALIGPDAGTATNSEGTVDSSAPGGASTQVASTPAARSTTAATTRSSTTSSRPTTSAPTSAPTGTPAARPAATSTLTSGERAIAAARPGTALAVAGALAVRGRAAKSGYDRAQFGQAWADEDRNGCDTRNDVLRRDLTGYVLRAGTNGCLVLKGTLRDPYTGASIRFVRGPDSAAVQVDHVVALADAWRKGAQGWPAAKRRAFANDGLNLLAVSGPANQRKSDGDAATWLPPANAYRCSYVARQTAVKHRYGLWVTAAERDATARVLTRCPAQQLPVPAAFRLGGGTVQSPPPPATRAPQPPATKVAPTPPTPPPAVSGGADPDLGTCKAVRAAGLGPYYAGKDPEYDWYRDADGDGIVCE